MTKICPECGRNTFGRFDDETWMLVRVWCACGWKVEFSETFYIFQPARKKKVKGN